VGKIVDKRDEIPLAELWLLLKSGLAVSYEKGRAVRIFTPKMSKFDVVAGWSDCKGGRFVVREMTKSA